MRNVKSILSVLLGLLLFASCEKVIEFDTTISDSELVLNGVPSAGKQLFVNLSYTHFFLDTNHYQPVNDMNMVVSVNGHDYHPTTNRLGNFFFDYTLQEDDSLAIHIQAGDHIITSHTTVPRMPDISTPMAFTSDTGTFHLLIVNFNIKDHPNYKDYYCITLRQRDSGSRYHPFLDSYDTIDTTYSTFFFCNDKALLDPFMAANMAVSGFVPTNQLLATDKEFDGQLHNTTLMLMLLRDTNEVENYIHQYSLDIETVSPDRYRYLQDIANATSLMQLITEPPAVYSNVEGALGIFAGNARKTYPLVTIRGGNKPPAPPSKQKGKTTNKK